MATKGIVCWQARLQVALILHWSYKPSELSQWLGLCHDDSIINIIVGSNVSVVLLYRISQSAQESNSQYLL